MDDADTEHPSLLPIIDLGRCTVCGLCVARCPTNAVEIVDAWPAIVRPHDCAYCGLCEEICPVEGIALAYEIVLPPSFAVEDTDAQTQGMGAQD